ncbi:protein of unknown function [Clostridium beijerinckii]|nr:protein of unknown function [Clostridium beijerinckii]
MKPEPKVGMEIRKISTVYFFKPFTEIFTSSGFWVKRLTANLGNICIIIALTAKNPVLNKTAKARVFRVLP